MAEKASSWLTAPKSECIKCLRSAAFDDAGTFDRIFLYDELRFAKFIPKQWVDAVEIAIQWDDVKYDWETFIQTCAGILIEHRLDSQILYQQVLRLVKTAPGWLTFNCAASYLEAKNHTIQQELVHAIKSSWAGLPPLARWLLWLRPRFRRMLVAAANSNGG